MNKNNEETETTEATEVNLELFGTMYQDILEMLDKSLEFSDVMSKYSEEDILEFTNSLIMALPITMNGVNDGLNYARQIVQITQVLTNGVSTLDFDLINRMNDLMSEINREMMLKAITILEKLLTKSNLYTYREDFKTLLNSYKDVLREFEVEYEEKKAVNRTKGDMNDARIE